MWGGGHVIKAAFRLSLSCGVQVQGSKRSHSKFFIPRTQSKHILLQLQVNAEHCRASVSKVTADMWQHTHSWK